MLGGPRHAREQVEESGSADGQSGKGPEDFAWEIRGFHRSALYWYIEWRSEKSTGDGKFLLSAENRAFRGPGMRPAAQWRKILKRRGRREKLLENAENRTLVSGSE